MEPYILAIYIFYNIVVLVTFAVDKKYSENKKKRIPEKLLWKMVFLMGALGAYFGMILFRHKTKKTHFRYGVPFLLFVQLVAIATYHFKIYSK